MSIINSMVGALENVVAKIWVWVSITMLGHHQVQFYTTVKKFRSFKPHQINYTTLEGVQRPEQRDRVKAMLKFMARWSSKIKHFSIWYDPIHIVVLDKLGLLGPKPQDVMNDGDVIHYQWNDEIFDYIRGVDGNVDLDKVLHDDRFVVLIADGQTRTYMMYHLDTSWDEVKVSCILHINLTIEKMRQLFLTLNGKRKPVNQDNMCLNYAAAAMNCNIQWLETDEQPLSIAAAIMYKALMEPNNVWQDIIKWPGVKPIALGKAPIWSSFPGAAVSRMKKDWHVVFDLIKEEDPVEFGKKAQQYADYINMAWSAVKEIVEELPPTNPNSVVFNLNQKEHARGMFMRVHSMPVIKAAAKISLYEEPTIAKMKNILYQPVTEFLSDPDHNFGSDNTVHDKSGGSGIGNLWKEFEVIWKKYY